MHLIQLEISLSGLKVRLALKLKELELPFEDPPGGTYRSDAFRAINPAGTIPTLVDGDFWLAESDAIIDYLDDIHAGKMLRSHDPQQVARSRMLSRWIDFRVEPQVRRLFAHVAPGGRDMAVVRSIDDELVAALHLVEQGLDREGPFACGAQPGMADCGFLSCLIWIESMTELLALRGSMGPRLTRVRDALTAHPALVQEVAENRGLARAWVEARN